jgi:hypothetical protein
MWKITDYYYYGGELRIRFKKNNNTIDYIVFRNKFLFYYILYSLDEIKQLLPSFKIINIINNNYRQRLNHHLLRMFKCLFDETEFNQIIIKREFKNTYLGKRLNNDVLRLIYSFIW